ncbi:hypothetical protein BO71DRAFT_328622 [Aspergillus ellipticus CBS 707.79]|uniref:Uncharacterized protein n=1 Tax=Aspergillus ellipticus CBS 707.79 TaxID=1448320 RepID=A0A319D6I7_9EURO|nr:hypothetical protein BO71DRAFT_328622 [Aspergillus ellipticus CBS 707.79]
MLIAQKDPRITIANIQGARAHYSSKDRSDNEKVITVGLATASGTRIGSVHVHMDGSSKFFPSRAGREGGYDTNIARARIEGHMDDSERQDPAGTSAGNQQDGQ